MATIETLLVKLETNMAQFTGDMNQMGRAVDKTAKQIEGALNSIKGAFAAVAAVTVFSKMAGEAGEAEKAMASLNQVLKSTGGVAGVTANDVTSLTANLQKYTGVSDDALNSTSALMLTFTNVSKKVFPDSIKAVNDMSVALGQDLKSSTIQLGKALNDPIKGISALSKVGVSFTSSQKDMVKSLVESGKTLEAQKLILAEINKEFGGAAAAARDTFGGAMKALEISINDVFETIGTSSNGGLRGAIEFLVTAFEHINVGIQEFGKWTQSSTDGAKAFRGTIDTIIGSLKFLGDSFMLSINLMGEFVRLVIDGGANAVKGFQMMGEQIFKSLPAPLQKAIEVMNTFVGTFTQKLVEDIPKQIAQGNKNMEAAGKDLFAPLRREFEKIDKESKERVAATRKLAESYKPKAPGGDDEDLGAASSKEVKKEEARQKAYASSLEALNKIIAAEVHRGDASVALTQEMKDQLRLQDEIAKINEQKGVGQLDKEIAIMKLQSAFTKTVAQEKAAAAAKEREDMQKHLDDLLVQQDAVERQAKGLPEITEQLKKQAEIDKAMAEGKTENLDLLWQQLGVLQQIDDITAHTKAQKQYDDELKKINEITEGYKEQQEAIIAKANGYENMLPLLKQEREIQKQIQEIQSNAAFSPEEKQQKTQELGGKIQEIRDGYNATQNLNDAIKAQDELVQKITSSNSGYYNQVQDLKQAFQAGQINLNQYTEAWKKLQSGTKQASDAGKEFADTIGKGLEDALFTGKKLTDVMKDLGKELAKMALKKLFIDPLKERAGSAFDVIGRNLFGLGKTSGVAGNAPAPNLLPPGVIPGVTPGAPLFNPAGAINANIGNQSIVGSSQSLAPIYSYGPVTLNGGQVSLNSPQLAPGSTSAGLGSILGGPALGSLSPSSSGGGGLLGGLLSPFKSLLGGGGSDGGGGLLGGVGKFFGSLFNFSGKSADQKSEDYWNGAYNKAMSSSAFPEFRANGGGMVAGRPYTVGDAGRELVIPGTDSMVVSNQQIRSAFSEVMNLRAQSGFVAASRPSIDDWVKSANPFNLPAAAVWTPEQQAFFGDNPYISAQSDASKYRDLLASTQRTAGTPMYKLTPGFSPSFPPEVKAALEKLQAFNALSPDDQRMARTNGSAFRNDEWAPIMAFYNSIPAGMEGKLRDLMRGQDVAFAESKLSETSYGPSNSKMWASDILNNKTGGDRYAGKIGLPDGDQLARMLTAWEHRTGSIDPEILAWANTRDYLADIIHPNGNWQALQMQSGTREGSGMAGQGSGMFQGVDIVDTAPVRNGWGEQGSGVESFARANIWGTPGSASNDPNGGWGSGLGYLRGWHKPVDGNNSSLLGKPPAAMGGGGGIMGMLAKLFGGGLALPESLTGTLPKRDNGIREWGTLKGSVTASGNGSSVTDISPDSVLRSLVNESNSGISTLSDIAMGSGGGLVKYLRDVALGNTTDPLTQALHGLAEWNNGNMNTPWGKAHYEWGARPYESDPTARPEISGGGRAPWEGSKADPNDHSFSQPSTTAKDLEIGNSNLDEMTKAFGGVGKMMQALGGGKGTLDLEKVADQWANNAGPFAAGGGKDWTQNLLDPSAGFAAMANGGIDWTNFLVDNPIIDAMPMPSSKPNFFSDLAASWGGLGESFFGGSVLGGAAGGSVSGGGGWTDWSWAKPFLEQTKGVGKLFSPVVDIGADVWSGASSFYSGGMGRFAPGADIYNQISNTASGIYQASPAWLQNGFDIASSLFSADPKMAGGNTAAGRVYQWQENGREYFTSDKDGYVHPANNERQKPSTINVYNYASSTHEVVTTEDLVNKVTNVVFREIQRAVPRSARV